MSLREIVLRYAQTHKSELRCIDWALDLIGTPTDFRKEQGYVLAALADNYEADLILDLGLGAGNSAAVASIACPETPVLSFGLDDVRDQNVWQQLRTKIVRHVEVVAGDLTRLDFAPLIGDARSVLVFWDAHGFEVAEHVLAHIMPLIADRKHVVLCHDISDNRVLGDWWRSYQGTGIWKGMINHYQSGKPGAYLNLGPFCTLVDQALAIVDFCTRNDLKLHSVDEEIHLAGRNDEWDAITDEARLEPRGTFAMAYFTMNETTHRHFPLRD